MGSKTKRTKKIKLLKEPATTVAISIAGIVVLSAVMMLGKNIFTSNSPEVPEGFNTATINTNITTVAPVVTQAPESNNSAAEQTTVSSADSSQLENLEKMFVNQYGYLHEKPDKDSTNLVCMSPGVEVTILGHENGYYKITFQNVDGPLTGYIYEEYLSSYDTQTTQAEQWQDNQNDAQWQDTNVQDNGQWQNNTQDNNGQWQNNGQ